MKIDASTFLSLKPRHYGKNILARFGLSGPPIDEKIIAANLGLKIRLIDGNEIKQEDHDQNFIKKILKDACAWLRKDPEGESIIYLYKDTGYYRSRLSIAHEIGHYLIPWHEDHSYFCKARDISCGNRRLEKEAYECGCEILMPLELFIQDALSLNTSYQSIEELSKHYKVSKEATAIRYVTNHPGVCSFSVIINQEDNDAIYPLKVKYFAKSRNFSGYVRPGTKIRADNPLYTMWCMGKHVRDEILFYHFFPSSRINRYEYEFIPFVNSGVAYLFMWLTDNQIKFYF